MTKWLSNLPRDIGSIGRMFQHLRTSLESVLRDNGDVLCPEDAGPVIRSPNGNYWRIEVDNAGVLSATDVTSEYTA